MRFKKNSQEIEKYQKEHTMCLVLKQHGFRVEHLSDEKKDGTYDIHLNGIPADLKRLKGYSNIVKRAIHAIHHQKAQLIVFQFDGWSEKYRIEIENLKNYNIHGMYFLSSDITKIHLF